MNPPSYALSAFSALLAGNEIGFQMRLQVAAVGVEFQMHDGPVA
jgi:hypothetical protein